MTRNEKQAWEKIRAKGRVRYIIVEGILRRGILAGIIFGPCPFLLVNAVGGGEIKWLWMGVLSVVLALLLGTLMGVLFWHLTEKNYLLSITDDHVLDLKNISKAELRILDRKLLWRYFRRAVLGLPILAFIFGSLSILQHSSPHREFYVWGIIIAAWGLIVSLIVFVYRGTRADCYEFGALCPKCNQPLYSAGGGPLKGRCRKCGYLLFDDSTLP